MADKKPKPTRKPRRLKPASAETVQKNIPQNKPVKAESLKKQSGPRAFIRGFFAPLRFVGRHLIPKYFRNSFRELRQVTWPSRKQTRQLTTAVILFAIVFAAFISILDLGLDKIFKRILLK